MGHVKCFSILHNLHFNAGFLLLFLLLFFLGGGGWFIKIMMMAMKVKLRVEAIAQSWNIKKDKKMTGRVQIALMIYGDCDLVYHRYIDYYE